MIDASNFAGGWLNRPHEGVWQLTLSSVGSRSCDRLALPTSGRESDTRLATFRFMANPLCWVSIHVLKREWRLASCRKRLQYSYLEKCERQESNLHVHRTLEPKSSASASSATLAIRFLYGLLILEATFVGCTPPDPTPGGSRLQPMG